MFDIINSMFGILKFLTSNLCFISDYFKRKLISLEFSELLKFIVYDLLKFITFSI